jgi:two-component system LytT family response regulator
VSEPIRTVIADDEPLARRQIRALLERDNQIALVAEATSGQEARRAIQQWQPELLLLDIRMPHGDGFQVLQDLQHPPYVIFATAHSEHAVRAFDVEAVDYLLKPFDDERFERALKRAKDAIRARRLVQLAQDIATARPGSEAPESRLAVHEGRRVVWVPLADIDWVEAADYYVQVHAQGRAFLLREPLQSLESRLGAAFLRVHRGALVNVARVVRLERQETGELNLVLANGARVTASRARRARVARALIRR